VYHTRNNMVTASLLTSYMPSLVGHGPAGPSPPAGLERHWRTAHGSPSRLSPVASIPPRKNKKRLVSYRLSVPFRDFGSRAICPPAPTLSNFPSFPFTTSSALVAWLLPFASPPRVLSSAAPSVPSKHLPLPPLFLRFGPRASTGKTPPF
jgi:hypothetical protein